ncbi:SusC/RagA family TonB-linked outer membrane protein [Maribellus sp. YY47]|uniref:SusC/RagA family TonB-linked outer membrane protein n=1 Tax=Maribellus sp. YY47 TaxID=2929486 RepID=UPI002001A059|nr:SusC/RagA family TonB-linked outer membrane protein [Maribellus sp. YY47]MCK3684663.1 SusC/RagA family TonB-linked outer membrane protein [Maribellus sp. YY47]
MKKIAILLSILLFMGNLVVNAQTRSIIGTVTSGEDDMPIPGVSVSVKGTTLGTVTNLDGRFELTVPADAKYLLFSFIGMKNLEVEIGSQTNFAVKMENAIIGVDEVVVTALGISRERKSLGYSVQQVGGEEISTIKGADFTSALSGKVAGLDIKTNTNFGGSTNVIVRGSASLTGNNQALFVVDGVPIDNTIMNDSYQKRGGRGYDYGSTASDINPNDIESISVLKGAAATALYGSRAANGVILITTKKGAKGKNLGISYAGNVTLGFVDKSTFPEYQKEYGGGYGIDWYSDSDYPGLEYWDWNDDGTDEYIVPTYEDASMGESFNVGLNVYQWNAFWPGLDTYGKAMPWVAAKNDPIEFFETATTTSNSIQVTGGSDNLTYRFSYQNLQQSGIMPNSELDKNNFSFSGSYDITSKLKVSSFANFIKTETKGRNITGYSGNLISGFRQWWQTNVDILEQKRAYEQLGVNATWNMNEPGDTSPAYWNNPYWQRYRNYQTDSRSRFIGYTKFDWQVADFLSFTGRVSVDYYSFLEEERLAVGSIAEAFGVGYNDTSSGYSVKRGDFSEYNFDLMANFNKDITDKLNLTGLIGTNIRKQNSTDFWASTNGGLAVEGIYSLANTASPLELPIEHAPKIQVNGYFANASLGYNDILFLEGSVRVDQASTLAPNNRTYVYPSATGSFIFTKFIDQEWFSFGKVRLNYAEVGNDAPFASLYNTYDQYYPFRGNGVASNDNTINNVELKPERSKSLEAGLTLNFVKNRLGLDVAVYDNRTVDQIMPAAISYGSGSSFIYVNAGEVSNKGVEIMLNATPVKQRGFTWDLVLNWSKNKNKVIDMAEGLEKLQLADLQGGVTVNAVKGYAMGTIHGTDFMYYNDIKDEAHRIITDGYYDVSASDQIIGDVNPDWIGGLRNTFSYKNLKLSFLIDWKHGGDVFSLDHWYGSSTGLYKESAGLNDLGNPVRNYVAGGGGVILRGVTADGAPNTVRSEDMGTYYTPVGSYYAPNALFIYDASYVKLRELSVTYSLPKSLFDNIFIQDASIALVGSNLWIIHKNLPYADPETSQGAGNIQGWQSGVMPSTRNIGFTLNVNF